MQLIWVKSKNCVVARERKFCAKLRRVSPVMVAIVLVCEHCQFPSYCMCCGED